MRSNKTAAERPRKWLDWASIDGEMDERESMERGQMELVFCCSGRVQMMMRCLNVILF